MSVRETLFSPVIQNNPIALQILGICSALAVTSSLQVSLVMSVALDRRDGFLIVLHFLHPELHSIEHSHHRSDDDHRIASHCG